MNNKLLTIGACSGAIAVALGAFAAHGLKDFVSEDQLRIFHTGVEYQFYHTFALIAVCIIYEKTKCNLLKISGWLFTIGIILLSCWIQFKM